MRLTVLLVVAVVVLTLTMILVLSEPASKPGPDSNNSIIHVPSSGRCPDQFRKSPRFFKEKDGSTQDACVSDTVGDGSIDVLKPGEGFDITIPLPIPNSNASEGERRKL